MRVNCKLFPEERAEGQIRDKSADLWTTTREEAVVPSHQPIPAPAQRAVISHQEVRAKREGESGLKGEKKRVYKAQKS